MLVTETLRESLSGQALLLTGASGFVGKAVLAQCLHELPELRVTVLLRGADPQGRLEQILAGDIFEGLDGSEVTALGGDLSDDDGLQGLGGIDVVIHCAASVSFEQALDDSLDLNGKGPARLLRALRAAGSDPYFVHVSTAYAAGQRTGLVLERPSGTAPSEPDIDLDAELDAARAWRRDLESESRLPLHQRRFGHEARRAVGPAGGPAIGARGEALRRDWVRDQLTERGRGRARSLGWTDTYGLSKAVGERRLMAERPRALTIVRPAIVESALRTPYPGWLESLKVADPILLAYGAGLIGGRFAANRSIRMDIVPVDMVANACLTAAGHPPEDGATRTLNVVSGSRNPLTVDRMAELVTRYFRERPLPGEDGLPVAVPEWRLSSHARITGTIDRATRLLDSGRDFVDRVPLPRTDTIELKLHKAQRRLDRIRRLSEIY
ncbi:MAG: alcohol-forming fatty acyl-CoA reductase, partial [Solirubrobacteraceae bacterium]|nr:alcohol-forming fatty acyl-CoA reductase [Solirubrobacteraceae bacterium]